MNIYTESGKFFLAMKNIDLNEDKLEEFKMKGFHVNYTDYHGRTPFTIAFRYGPMENVILLWKNGAKVREKINKVLLDYLFIGQIKIIDPYKKFDFVLEKNILKIPSSIESGYSGYGLDFNDIFWYKLLDYHNLLNDSYKNILISKVNYQLVKILKNFNYLGGDICEHVTNEMRIIINFLEIAEFAQEHVSIDGLLKEYEKISHKEIAKAIIIGICDILVIECPISPDSQNK